jgi:tetratricopeptide (TPR) repeat protein/TolB-like protein
MAAAWSARPVAAADVPDWIPGPDTVAVTPFENHVPSGKSFEWMVAGAPFEIATKIESVLGLDVVGAPLYVPGERVPAEDDTVADHAAKVGARFVVTGWFDRIGDQLRIAILVWRADGPRARVVGEAQRMGALAAYHKILGEALAEAWTEAGIAVDISRRERLSRALSRDIYPVFVMGRGLGHLTGALAAMHSVFGTGLTAPAPGPDLEAARADLERAVFLDPKLFEAQRLLGELYLQTAGGDAKLLAKATGKLTYAADLAPDDMPSLRAAAAAMSRVAKWELALALWRKVIASRPWDLPSRYQLGAALWHVGEVQAAERQLEQVTARLPDHLPARRVLVLIHASRGDTRRLIGELEAIATRAPDDLEVKDDLATAYGALGAWDKAVVALEQIIEHRPGEVGLLVRAGDAHRRHGSLDSALAWYQRAARGAPELSLPGYAAAQALFDAGRIVEAQRAYTNLQKFTAERAHAEHALGVIALVQGQADQAAWYLRHAARNGPRSLVTRRALVAAELRRKDPEAARSQLDAALAAWPDDGYLHYLAGITHVVAGDPAAARTALLAALDRSPGLASARAALGVLGAGGTPALDYQPELVRPWGDGEALAAAVGHYDTIAATMAGVRIELQAHMLALLGQLGQGPEARVKGVVRTCAVGRLAPTWAAAQRALARYARLGVELETAHRFVTRHDELGLGQGLLPTARASVARARRSFRITLADIGELRATWTRGVVAELRAAGCTDKLLAAAVADPQRYRVIGDDKPPPLPARELPRPRPRTTFFVDNTRCPESVAVWIDGTLVGEAAPGRRSALLADGGERTLCLLSAGGARCGDRGTVRQVYLFDGWSVTMHCQR